MKDSHFRLEMTKRPKISEHQNNGEGLQGRALADWLSQTGRQEVNQDFEKAENYAIQIQELGVRLNDPTTTSLAYNLKSDILFARGSYIEAEEHARRALELQQVEHDEKLLVRTYTQIANNCLRQNNFEECLSYYDQVLKIHRKFSNDTGLALVYSNLCLVYKELRKFDESLQNAEKARRIYKKLKHLSGEARVLANRGTIFFDLGMIVKSLRAHLESLRIREKIGDTEGMTQSLGCIGICLNEQGKLSEAIEYIEKALDLSKNLQNNYYTAHFLNDLAGIFEKQQNYEQGLKFSFESLKYARAGGIIDIEIYSLSRIAETYKKMGSLEAAVYHAKKAAKLANHSAGMDWTPKINITLGHIYFEMGRLDLAEKLANEVLHSQIITIRKSEQAACYELLVEVNKARNDWPDAFQFQEKITKLNEEIYASQMDDRLLELKERLELDKAIRDAELTKLKNVKLVKKNQTINRQRKELAHSSEEYRKLAAALTDSNSMKELLLDIITHDLKNPAAAINGLAQIALLDQPGNEVLAAIQHGSTNLLQVLASTTVLTQSILGEEIPKEITVLNEVLVQLKNEMSSELAKQGMQIKLALEPNLVVDANPLIAEVFRNYLSNAMKYASSGKVVQVVGERDGDEVLVKVKDFGTTIPASDRETIFARRVQLSVRVHDGRGLGLAIVKRIADAHHATVWVEPNVPRGNSFCFRMSAAPA